MSSCRRRAKYAGEERQDEQTGVPREPGRLLVGEAGSEACDLDRDSRGRSEDERLEPAAAAARRLVSPLRTSCFQSRPLCSSANSRDRRVDVPQPLHGDQERLIGCEPGRVQLGDLVTKMILQLIDVVAVDARGACDVGPPLCDL